MAHFDYKDNTEYASGSIFGVQMVNLVCRSRHIFAVCLFLESATGGE